MTQQSVIAAEFGISVNDVKRHIKELFEKTGYSNGVELVGDVLNKGVIVSEL